MIGLWNYVYRKLWLEVLEDKFQRFMESCFISGLSREFSFTTTFRNFSNFAWNHAEIDKFFTKLGNAKYRLIFNYGIRFCTVFKLQNRNWLRNWDFANKQSLYPNFHKRSTQKLTLDKILNDFFRVIWYYVEWIRNFWRHFCIAS